MNTQDDKPLTDQQKRELRYKRMETINDINQRLLKENRELMDDVQDARVVIINLMAVINDDDIDAINANKKGNDFLRKTANK